DEQEWPHSDVPAFGAALSVRAAAVVLIGVGLRRPSPLDVRELLGDLSGPYAKDVDAPDRAAFPLLGPGIHPTHHATIAGREYLLRIEMCVGRARKELLPERSHEMLPLEAFTVGLRPGILEGTVVAHERHDGVDVVSVEGVVEALHHLDHAVRVSVGGTR